MLHMGANEKARGRLLKVSCLLDSDKLLRRPERRKDCSSRALVALEPYCSWNPVQLLVDIPQGQGIIVEDSILQC
jgi:hypothetical protein